MRKKEIKCDKSEMTDQETFTFHNVTCFLYSLCYANCIQVGRVTKRFKKLILNNILPPDLAPVPLPYICILMRIISEKGKTDNVGDEKF